MSDGAKIRILLSHWKYAPQQQDGGSFSRVKKERTKCSNDSIMPRRTKTKIKEIEIVTSDVVGMHVRVEAVDEFETQLAEQCKISVNLHARMCIKRVRARHRCNLHHTGRR